MNLEQILTIAMLVPMTGDDPSDPECQWGLPLMLEGAPGIGKSGRIESIAEALGLKAETILAGTHQPEDFSGAPMKNKHDEVKIECILPAVNELVARGSGVLFLDEITCARPAVQGALLGVVYKRKVGSTKLPGAVRIMAAGNPADSAAGGWDLAPAMANRLAWLSVPPPTPKEWSQWLLEGTRRQDALADGEDRIKAQWQKTYSRIKGLGAAFSEVKPELLHALPAEDNPDRHRAWPSPRSWEFALRSMAACQILGHPELTFDFVKACIGEGAATEFAGWLLDMDLPDPEDMLRNGWTPDPSRIDIAMGALSAMVTFVKNHDKGKKRDGYAAKAWLILDSAAKVGLIDAAVTPSTVLLHAGYQMGDGADEAMKKAMAPVMQPLLSKIHQLGMSR